jgi:hypothetical protein
MGRSESGVNALQLVESVKQLLRKDWIAQRAGGHSFLFGRFVCIHGNN